GPGGEAFELGQDGVGGVAVVAVGDMGVAPHGVAVAGGAGRVGQVLLAHQHEGPFRHAAPVDVPFRGGDLGPGAAEMDGPRLAAPLVGPGDTALDGEVDLEGARPVLPAAVGPLHPSGEPVAGDVGHRPGGEVEVDGGGR